MAQLETDSGEAYFAAHLLCLGGCAGPQRGKCTHSARWCKLVRK